MLTGIKIFLSGRKTYLISISAIFGIVIAWLNGSVSDMDAISKIVEALLAMTIRAGVTKSGS